MKDIIDLPLATLPPVLRRQGEIKHHLLKICIIGRAPQMSASQRCLSEIPWQRRYPAALRKAALLFRARVVVPGPTTHSVSFENRN
jgi:hypothetical protein